MGEKKTSWLGGTHGIRALLQFGSRVLELPCGIGRFPIESAHTRDRIIPSTIEANAPKAVTRRHRGVP